MDTKENKLSSEELNDLLKEVESTHRTMRTVNPHRKKKPTVRIDMIIAAVVALIVVIGIVFLIAHFVGKSNSNAKKSSDENPLQVEKYEEISDVVKNYLNAFLIEDNQKRAQVMAQYVGNMYDINSIKRKDYVSSYSDIECYTKDGPYENTYIVFAYYNMGIKNISTKAPCVDRMYVVRDTKTGNVYIQNAVGSDIKKYMDEIEKDADVQDLLADVKKEFDQAKASDPNLKAFFDKLEAGIKKSKETTVQQTTAAQKETTAQPATTAQPTNQ